ncbi:CAP domain-containing protein [Hutsoniella sourekii]
MQKNNELKVWLSRLGKGILVAGLGAQVLVSQPLHQVLADDDDYEDYEDYDYDDYGDYDDYDDYEGYDDDDDDDYDDAGYNTYVTETDNVDDYDDDDDYNTYVTEADDDDDSDDDDDDRYILFNGVWLEVDSDADLEDIWEEYYETVDDYDDDDQKQRARPNQTGNKVNKDYLDVELEKNPNFMNPEVTPEDDPKQGLEVGQTLDNGNKVEELTIKEETPIPTLAQGDKETQYQNAQNQEKINTVTVKDPNEATQTQAIKVNEKTQQDVNTNTYIDETLLNQEFLALLNADRQAAGLKPVEYGTHLQQGVNTRTNDLATIGHIRVNDQPHVRLDGSSFREDFNYLGEANKNSLGENTAMSTYNGNPNTLVSEKALAEQFYQQWKESPSHYENMMSPDYNFSAISVKMSDKNQLAGDGYNSLIGVQVLDTSVR